MLAFKFFVHGRVQGVGYRYFALKEAQALGVAGYTRNLPDGRVEVVAEGADAVVERFEARLSEGPAFAEVDGLERVAIEPRGAQGFHIR